MEKEIWKKIDEFPDYSVSNLGRIRRETKPKVNGKTWPGKILKQVNGTNGYVSVGIWKGGKKITRHVHNIVAAAFLGKKPSKKHTIAHYDGNKKNPKLSNLRWATYSENFMDKNRHGTMIRGEDTPNSVLKKDQVFKIISMKNNGYNRREIAEYLSVPFSAVSHVYYGSTWKWLLKNRNPAREAR